MVDGLANAVVHDVKYSTSSRDMVLDTMGLNQEQKGRLLERISTELQDYEAQQQILLYWIENGI